MYMIFVLGTAGSGKTTFTHRFTSFLEFHREDVMAVNLDPGALVVPFPANVDVRDYIRVEEVMEEYGLGPNGGLMLAHDMMEEIVEDLSREIEEYTPEICIVDTPGQMELFAFRDIGARIAHQLTDAVKGVVYIFDGLQCRDPLNYVMNMFLASAIDMKFLLPMFHVLSKVDGLSPREAEEIASWSSKPEALEDAVNDQLKGLHRSLSQDMLDVVNRLGTVFEPIPVSNVTNDGYNDVYAQLMMAFTDGGRFTP